MLEPTLTKLIKDARLRPDAIAFCEQTGANLTRSRRHPWYVLIVPTGEETVEERRWSRRTLLTDEHAMKVAQRALNRIKKASQAAK